MNLEILEKYVIDGKLRKSEVKIAEHRTNAEKLCKEFKDKTDKELGLYFKDNISIYAPIIFNNGRLIYLRVYNII